MDIDVAVQKSHRDRHSGRKADKKRKKSSQDPAATTNPQSDRQRNPRAFAINSAVRAERRFRRRQDIETKKQHVPLVDRTPLEPPPILIAVVGPPKVGKSTLINNLIKLFTRAPLTAIQGPVTVVTGKRRRITLIECANDVSAMIDLAKVADLVLLLCDASFGFEMEIFEFLNICQVHGMPRIMGVLTHLDLIRNAKTLKQTKKVLKHRFWTEVYAGAKLFYLSGLVHDEYLRNEIRNLGRFICVMKFRPLVWRSTHSYMLCDRYEDLTDRELMRQSGGKCDRNVSLYGYVRGLPIQKRGAVHVAGLGDLKIVDVTYLPDPCPLPDQMKKRALIDKEKLIYAPFSGVGGLVYDKDAVYVELGGSHSHQRNNNDATKDCPDNETTMIVANLIDAKESLDAKIDRSELQLFTNSAKIISHDFSSFDDQQSGVNLKNQDEDTKSKHSRNHDDDNNLLNDELRELRQKNGEELIVDNDSGRQRRKVIFAESDEQMMMLQNDGRKNNEIHEKISSVLKQFDDNNEEKRINDDDDDDELMDEDDSDGLLSSSDDDDDDQDDDSDASSNNIDLKWKDNLAKKAQDSFFNRKRTNQNLMKLVYGVFDTKYQHQKDDNTNKNENDEAIKDENNEDDIGGLFKKASYDQRKINLDKDNMNRLESSVMLPWNHQLQDWLDPQNKLQIVNCFVTGQWKESEDAGELLKLDDNMMDSDNNSVCFGDFEDLETGEKFNKTPTQQPNNDTDSSKNKIDDDDDLMMKSKLIEKKRKLKEQFNMNYDENGVDNNNTSKYYDDLKGEMTKQSELNKTVFDQLPDDLRVEIEGYRAGMYVRIEFNHIPCEFVTNFNATYPLIVGALNCGEETVGYVNVKLKKHRWYERILKTNDPLIVSMGWRRFQTIPLYSKLEDDLKYRYLKYTPQHFACNAHFWGPITPQSTGFLALQTIDSTMQGGKQGFRIAATGTVQELDKSTQIMKKLKLIGYPMKIYKKTAFIKGMFNSALEVGKFEGARIKTVSGIRGQIKKAASKPDGCFRATFEDKIQLSDIVFCRTWYKIDVPQFYNPVTTLLLPIDEKNQWKGLKTTGEIKRQQGIRNQANLDSLYTDIKREAKPFKPFIIPHKLQKALPYRDKPKHGVKLNTSTAQRGAAAASKKMIDRRVAVVRDPYEQDVAKMMKMLKATYQHKQERIKAETKQRLDTHRQQVALQEASKLKKLKEKKKEVFRKRSKSQIKRDGGGRKNGTGEDNIGG